MNGKGKTTLKHTSRYLFKAESTELEAMRAVELSIEHFNKHLKNVIKTVPIKIPIRLIWTGKGKLQELVHILYKKKFIKSKKEFFALFDDSAVEKTVRWNPGKKYLLAYLLFKLYQEKYILLNYGKGYFKYAEEHFTDFNNTPFKKNELKKLKLKIALEKDKYAPIIRSQINEIISLRNC